MSIFTYFAGAAGLHYMIFNVDYNKILDYSSNFIMSSYNKLLDCGLFTKVPKYVAGMAGLYFLRSDMIYPGLEAFQAWRKFSAEEKFNVECGWYAARNDVEAYCTVQRKGLNGEIFDAGAINLFDNCVTQNKYVDCIISKYITQNYISNKWVQYGVMAGISGILAGAHDLKFSTLFIQSCILKAISDDYESKVDNDIQIEVQPQDSSISTQELFNSRLKGLSDSISTLALLLKAISDDYESKVDNDIQIEVQSQDSNISMPELLNV